MYDSTCCFGISCWISGSTEAACKKDQTRDGQSDDNRMRRTHFVTYNQNSFKNFKRCSLKYNMTSLIQISYPNPIEAHPNPITIPISRRQPRPTLKMASNPDTQCHAGRSARRLAGGVVKRLGRRGFSSSREQQFAPVLSPDK